MAMLILKKSGQLAMWKALAVTAAIAVGLFAAFKAFFYAQATFNSSVNWILLVAAVGSFLVWGAIKTYNNKQQAKLGVKTFFDAIPSLLLLIIVIGGIVAGYFTATEASAIAVLYSLILALIYGVISMKHLPEILLRSVKTTGLVLLLVATSIGLSWVMAYENIPQNVTAALMALSGNPIVILLIINVILLFVGVFMDMTPAVLIFTPIFLPIVSALGVDPVHFGIMMTLNLSVGLCTPPVGSVLFIGCSVAGLSIDKVIKPLIPMFIAMIVVLLLVTYLPEISLWLPHKFGF